MSERVNPEWKPEPILLTFEQAATILNVSYRTIRRLVARRELVRRKVGGCVLIPRTSVENFVKRDHETGGSASIRNKKGELHDEKE